MAATGVSLAKRSRRVRLDFAHQDQIEHLDDAIREDCFGQHQTV